VRGDGELHRCQRKASEHDNSDDFHEVDDVDHWLSSPRRAEFFGPLGMSARTFVDPEKSNRVGLLVECPDMATFQSALQSEAAADAM
jgi:hypothetical protein